MTPSPLITFWSVDLSTTTAGVLVYLAASLILLVVYLRMIPWLDNPKKPHPKVRWWIEALVMIVIITDFLSIAIYPPMWSKGILYAVFVFRQIPNGAHVSSYMTVFVLVILAFFKWNDALKAVIFGGKMVFYHEALWFPFYYLSNWGSLNIPLDLAFVMWMTVFQYVSWKKYQMKVWMSGMFCYFGYLLSWFMLGFPITVKNISHLSVFYETQWYGVFTAESNEVMSWLLMFAVFLYSLVRLNGKGWKVREILGL